jgi:hypothetical protein
MTVGLGPAPAGASVIAESGQAVLAAPVSNTTQGDNESNTLIHFFAEQTGLTLPSALPVDITPPATFPADYQGVSQLTPGTLPAGTRVDSYFLYSDPIGQPLIPVSYSATVTFSTPILGLIVTAGTLAATDAEVGAPGTTYSTNKDTGLEASDQVELVGPDTLHLHFETFVDTDDVRVITAASNPAIAGAGATSQYTEVASDGGIFNFGSDFYGSEGGRRLDKPMVGGAQASGRPGYWTVASDGGVFAFGAAPFEGSMGGHVLDSPIVGMASTADGRGYWLVAADGGVFSFGNARFHGSLGRKKLDSPIVGMAPTPDGDGYWLVAADGGVFSFGNAVSHGSAGSLRLVKPVVGMATTPDGGGYWLVTADGGVFSYGNAVFEGSTGGRRLAKPIVAIKASPDGGGYWLLASDGGVFTFGDAVFHGSMGGHRLDAPVVGAF